MTKREGDKFVVLDSTGKKVLGIYDSDFDCQACGACCVAPDARDAWYVMDDELQKIPTKVNNQGVTVCKHLNGIVGKHVWCAIYDYRPSACATFRVGGSWCQAAQDQLAATEEFVHDIGCDLDEDCMCN